MIDSARQIENLLYTYAERIDAGDLDGVADLFEHGRIAGMENGPPETVFEGTARVRQMYGMATRLYEDGTPKTKHMTSNVRIDVDERRARPGARRTTSSHRQHPTYPSRSSSPGTTTTPSTASTASGGSTPGSCSSIRWATPATT